MPADDLSLRPANRGRAAGNSLARSGLIAAISWLVLACIAAGSGCVPASSAKTSDEANLVGTARLAVCDVETGQLISSNRIELGQVERGSKTDSTLVLRNSGPASVTIDAWETSCDCLKMPNVPLEIQPGKACQFSFALDLADEHEFRGGLLIAVAGKSRGETLLQMEVDVQVSDQ